MKIGAAAVAGLPIIAGSPLFAQQPPSSSATSVQPQPSNPAVAASESGGWDEPSRQLVDYAASFSEANLSDRVAEAAGYTLLDTMAALIAGFEVEPVRIGARLARQTSSELKSTVMGYGITTSPEMATFVNGCMLRCAEFNDVTTGGHFSDMISAILADGEAFRASGAQVLAAVVLSYDQCGRACARLGQPIRIAGDRAGDRQTHGVEPRAACQCFVARAGVAHADERCP